MKLWHKFLTVVIAASVMPSALYAEDQSQPEPGQIPALPPRMPVDVVPAFPGAWGGGMFTTGGRGGRVIAVTNLNDSGEGSFRAAAEATGPRIVIFRVAGVIDLLTNVDINSPDITIAGQSAPGDGICFAGQSLNINTSNVIVRHLRVRRGKPEGGQGSDNIGGNPTGQIIVDHCSTSWGMDENLSLYRSMRPGPLGSDIKYAVKNLTIQYCISSEALNAKNHAFGGTWGGEDSTFHHNLFACNTARNPSIGMSGEFDYRNNVVFNWGHRSMDGGDETSMINVINNYYKPGPATNENMKTTIARIESRDMYSPGSRFKGQSWFPAAQKRPGKWYVAGNYIDGSAEATGDNWMAVKSQDRADAPPEARVNSPFEAWPVPQQTASEAYQRVMEKVGATLPKRDPVDSRVIEMVKTGKPTTGDGIITDPKQVGGFPEYTFDPSQLAADDDGDGMSDEFERSNGFNPNDAKDGSLDSDGDGYTNVEEFLNGTNPKEKIDYMNFDNNVDTIS